MALHENYGDFNKLVESLPVVRYESTPTYHTPEGGQPVPVFWTMTRQSSHSFKYIGLTEAAASECAAALRKAYTQKYMAWTASVDTSDPDAPRAVVSPVEILRCGASIDPRLVAGDNWEVAVQVEESDTVICDYEITDAEKIEEYFQQCASRVVVPGSIYVFRVDRGMNYVDVFYFANVSDFDASRVRVYYYWDSKWHEATVSVRGDGYVRANVSGLAYPFRVIYDNASVSNEKKAPVYDRRVRMDVVTLSFRLDFDDEVRPAVGAEAPAGYEAGVNVISAPAGFSPANPRNWSIDLGAAMNGFPFEKAVKSITGDGTYSLAKAKDYPSGGRAGIVKSDLERILTAKLVYNDGSVGSKSDQFNVHSNLAHRVMIRSAELVSRTSGGDAVFAVRVLSGLDFSLPSSFAIGFDFDETLLVNLAGAQDIIDNGVFYDTIHEYVLTFRVQDSEIPEGITAANAIVRYAKHLTSGDVFWWSNYKTVDDFE